MTLLEFIGRYLSDENLREEVFTDERDLKKYVEAGYALRLARLDEQDIFSLIKTDAKLTDPQVVALKEFLKAVGFDANKAKGIIWGSDAMCQLGDPSAMKGGGGYGGGEVHLRKVDPRTAPSNQPVEIELAGQGFNRALQVKFVHTVTNVEVMGTITKWRADADVHQYRTVKVTFPSSGLWGIWLWDSIAGDFRSFTCGITVT
jgi:hypothetical protein